MDQKRKELFRAKLRESAQKREKRIDSPLVRYNEFDQAVCKVCNFTLKSESHWPAHQVSRKHHEAIEKLRAAAAASGVARGNSVNQEQPTEVQKTRPSSTLPADFFENKDSKKQKIDASAEERARFASSQVEPRSQEVSPSSSSLLERTHSVTKTNELAGVYTKETQGPQNRPTTKLGETSRKTDGKEAKQAVEDVSSERMPLKNALPDGFFDKQFDQANEASSSANAVEAKQVKGALPEGFFDNKDADLRARGIKPVKIDVDDAYKEFEKEIQDNLREVDDRLEEEEIGAAEEREEYLILEQREYRENVDMVKQKLVEVKAAKIARAKQKPAVVTKELSDESSSDEGDDDDEIFSMDWRAQHL
ncbi:zinc finger protein 830 isoform X2 [Ananas comosus]|uniref:Zinc finger protein 830 isoform X2 n=1 Tax=Ananas comosus TaxID=4615 RepID=A0A6P5FW04_ANACO|nr:zinc finger protein 830 isoform X2 [Ananas comosus]